MTYIRRIWDPDPGFPCPLLPALLHDSRHPKQTKVSDHHLVGVVENVLWLQVFVDDFFSVQVTHSLWEKYGSWVYLYFINFRIISDRNMGPSSSALIIEVICVIRLEPTIYPCHKQNLRNEPNNPAIDLQLWGKSDVFMDKVWFMIWRVMSQLFPNITPWKLDYTPTEEI